MALRYNRRPSYHQYEGIDTLWATFRDKRLTIPESNVPHTKPHGQEEPTPRWIQKTSRLTRQKNRAFRKILSEKLKKCPRHETLQKPEDCLPKKHQGGPWRVCTRCYWSSVYLLLNVVQSTIFQLYMWWHTDAQADYIRRSWTYGWAPTPQIFRRFGQCHCWWTNKSPRALICSQVLRSTSVDS